MGDTPPRISDTGVLTTTSLVLIAAFALLVIFGIIWGARLKRQRTVAEHDERTRMDEEPPQPPAGDSPAAESVEDQRSAPPRENAGDERSPATASARPDAVALPEPAAEPGTRPAPSAPAPTAPAPPPLATPPDAAAVPPAEGAVTLLKGLGPKVAARLAELGITTIGQIAALDAGEADRLDAQLGPFAGRLSRDRWIEQARFLAAGDRKGFEAVFGRL